MCKKIYLMLTGISIPRNIFLKKNIELSTLRPYMDVVKKGFVFIAALTSLLISNAVSAQQLTLFNIDTSQYPTVKANFFAIDGFENQITILTKDDVVIKENSIDQEVINVLNPVAVKPKQLSVVLTIDISESMHGAYMQLAKNAATALVNKLPLDVSECAITSFDDASFINTDFTRDRQKLQESIRSLTPGGGTDYNKGFLKPHAGGLDILKNGLHEKVLIFLTDGYGDVTPPEIIQKARLIGARVYVITLGMSVPEELKKVVGETNGKYYENVISEQEINAVYLSILYRSQGLEPSNIEWISKPGCGYSKKVLFSEKKNMLKPAPMQYTTPTKNIVRLTSDANTITFNEAIKEFSVSLKALNGDFNVTSFNTSKAFFSIESPSLPRIIKKDASENFIIKYSGTYTEFLSGRIELTSDGCQSTFIYYQYQPASDRPALNLISPDGNEKYFVGQETLIRWSLQNTKDPVKISFSTNAGKNWEVLLDSTRADHFNWRIPNKPGTTNLIKVETRAENRQVKAESKMIYDGFTDIMNAYNLSPDGSRYISQTTTELFLHDTYTNAVINKIKNTIKKGYFIFSPDGKYILIYDEGKPIRVYDGSTFEFIQEWGIFRNTLSTYIEPYINNDLTEYVAKDIDGNFTIFHFKTGGIAKKIPFVKGKEVTDFTQNYVVTIDELNHRVWVWDYGKETKVLEIVVQNEQVVNAEFNSDETTLLVYTWGTDGTRQDFTAYDLTGKKLYAFENTARAFMSLDTYQNYALCSVGNYPALIDINTGKVVLTYMLPSTVKFGWFVPFSNGKYVLFTSTTSKNVYMVTSGISDLLDRHVQDQSNSAFTIVSTKPQVKTIKFPAEYVGSVVDSVVTSCIKNNASVGIEIREITIEGKAAASFKILNPITAVRINPVSNQQIEIRFMPQIEGLQEAFLKVTTIYDTVRVPISGIGVKQPFTLQADQLNLGLVDVGKIKDTLFMKVLTNTSAGMLYITSMSLLGPDKTQFKILSPTALTLAPGSSAEIKMNFSPTKRGRTSTQLNIVLKDAVRSIKLPVYAEGYLPRQYSIQLNFVDAITNMSVPAVAVCVDQQSGKSIDSKLLNNGQSSLTDVYADRIYVFTITKKGYKPVIDTLDLLKPISENKIVQVIELMSEASAAMATRTLTGNIFIKSTRSPLWAYISIYNAATKTLVKKIESDPDGLYKIELPPGTYHIQVEKDGYVNENVTLEITSSTQNLIKDFEMTLLKVGETIRLPHVYFARGGVALLESSNESLDQLYTLLNDNPKMRIELLGYTDNQGDANLNIRLSEQRVAAIKDYLVAKGISETRITGKGYGGSKPIASNATEETRQLNRRVEFKIISM